jgi:molybdopterin molybdotransferase
MSAFDRVPVGRALAWVDAATAAPLESEDVALETGAGRVLATDLRSARAMPPADCAATDGYAVCAQETLGAAGYNPITAKAIGVEAGEALPPGTDAVVPLDQAEPDTPDRAILVEPLAAGANVDRAGAIAAAEALLVAAGTLLTPRHIGMSAIAGHARAPLFRRPRVRLVIAGKARSGGPFDGNRPMLRGLIERDGGIIVAAPLAKAFDAGVDIVLVAGGTGRGREDRSAAALAGAGSLAIHGVALSPGETAGFGHTAAGTAVLLLPGAPAACLWNYELFAGRAIRRLGGRDAALPYASRPAVTARKIVSAIGMTEICPIRRLADGRVEPVAPFAEAGLMAAIQGDGVVIIPPASEGVPAGTRITAYFYDDDRIGAEPAR